MILEQGSYQRLLWGSAFIQLPLLHQRANSDDIARESLKEQQGDGLPFGVDTREWIG